jgi:hypothetical protein
MFHEINFTAPASLRKYPSLNGKRNSDARYANPYLLHDGTLDECIKEFLSKPAAAHHLYEIHTSPQPPLVTEVLKGRWLGRGGIIYFSFTFSRSLRVICPSHPSGKQVRPNGRGVDGSSP